MNSAQANRLFRLRTATLLNPGLILKWTNVAHVRPCCWTLVWSWNELTLLTYGHVVESWPDLDMNSAQVAFLDFVRPCCWIVVFLVITNRLKVQLSEDRPKMMNAFTRERAKKKKKSFYIHPSTVFTDRLNLFYFLVPRKSPRASWSPFFLVSFDPDWSP